MTLPSHVRCCTALVVTLALPACSDRPTDSDTAGSTDDATTGDPPPTSTAPATTAGDATATGDATTTPGDTSDTGDTTTTGGDPLCPPPPGVAFGFTLDPAPDDFTDIVLEWDCTVLDAALTADGATLGLECTQDGAPVEPPPRILLKAAPVPPALGVPIGAAVHVRYEQLVPWWTERSLRIDAGDVLLLAAASTSGELDPFTGIGLAPIDPHCPPTDDDFCGPEQHEGLQVDLFGASGEVHSREFTEIGAFGVWAPRMAHYVDSPECTDTPSQWRSLAVLRLTP